MQTEFKKTEGNPKAINLASVKKLSIYLAGFFTFAIIKVQL